MGNPNVEFARLTTVIEVAEIRGSGEKHDPTRLVTSFWSLQGKKLFENDPHAGSMAEAASTVSSIST